MPASYRQREDRRYPVIYLLPGLGGNETVRFSDAAPLAHADDLGARLGQEAILVGVYTRNRYGSVYFTGRTLAGPGFEARGSADEQQPRTVHVPRVA